MKNNKGNCNTTHSRKLDCGFGFYFNPTLVYNAQIMTKKSEVKNEKNTKAAKTTAKKADKKSKSNSSSAAKKSKSSNEPALIGPNTVVTLTIPAKQASEAYKKALGRLSKRVKLAGFRAGKVPTHLAEKELGSAVIIEQALEYVLPEIYQKEISSKNLKPITNPEFKAVSLEKDSDWVVEAQIAEQPTIDLKDYKKAVKEGKKAAEQEIKKLAKNKKTGHKHDHDHDHDHHHHDHKEPSEEDILLTNIYQKLVTTLKPTLPELLVKDEVRADMQNLSRRLESLNLNIDDYLKQQGMSYDDLTNQLAVSAIGRLQLMFILEAISVEAKLEITDKEVEAEINKTEDKQQKQQMMQDDRYKNFLKQTLKRDKLASYLLSL